MKCSWSPMVRDRPDGLGGTGRQHGSSPELLAGLGSAVEPAPLDAITALCLQLSVEVVSVTTTHHDGRCIQVYRWYCTVFIQ